MNTFLKFIRIVLALMFALGALGFSASTALAAPPEHGDFSFTASGVITGMCPFEVTVSNVNEGHYILFFDKNGNVIGEKDSVVEQDTFTANGKTLVSMPYTFEIKLTVDSSGNFSSFYASGVVVKVWLPDGSLFVSAGRVNWLNHASSYVWSPDFGHTGDVEAFCAALE